MRGGLKSKFRILDVFRSSVDFSRTRQAALHHNNVFCGSMRKTNLSFVFFVGVFLFLFKNLKQFHDVFTHGDIDHSLLLLSSNNNNNTNSNETQEEEKVVMPAQDKLLFLNESDESTIRTTLRTKVPQKMNSTTTTQEFSVDIIVIGSQHNVPAVQTQMDTWGSHPSRRHFFMTTEQDAPNPNCTVDMTREKLESVVRTCKSRRFWTDLHHGKENTNSHTLAVQGHFRNQFARMEWLLGKANPSGWMCAQPRFGWGVASLLEMYRSAAIAKVLGQNNNDQQEGKYDSYLPDYLFVADDDTHLNMEHLVNALMRQPLLSSSGDSTTKTTKATATTENTETVPSPITPVVFAGCRVRAPVHQVNFTFAWGGFGTFFSKGALRRMIQPLHCNKTTSSQFTTDTSQKSFEQEACARLLDPERCAIGEHRFYKSGMSIIDLMKAYTKGMHDYCVHSDWFLGYFINSYHISRHTVPTGDWFDDRLGDAPTDRLHSFERSGVYRSPEGHCKPGCLPGAPYCHNVNSSQMWHIHSKN